jgi:hypothetical protein
MPLVRGYASEHEHNGGLCQLLDWLAYNPFFRVSTSPDGTVIALACEQSLRSSALQCR